MWLNGPGFLQRSEESIHRNTVFLLLDPENDKEIRTDVIVQKTQLSETPLINRFRKFGSLITLVRAIAHLKQFMKSFKAKRKMTHLSEPKKLNPQIMKEAETVIVKETQRNFYLEDIDALDALRRKCQINKTSNLVQLNPFLDSDGTLRVGGRLKNAYLSQTETNPIILPGQSHLAKLMIRSCHEKVFHQGRHITEALFYQVVTGLQDVNDWCRHSYISASPAGSCVERNNFNSWPIYQNRLMVGPSFMNVDLDVFGPWQVMTRKTRAE